MRKIEQNGTIEKIPEMNSRNTSYLRQPVHESFHLGAPNKWDKTGRIQNFHDLDIAVLGISDDSSAPCPVFY
jgi:hypothetical protein